MHKFVRNLITEWRRLELPSVGATVVVAVSGGADSVSLLLAMHELSLTRKLGLRIIAAHFNHRLREPDSETDEEYVRSLTADRGIEFAVGHGDIHSVGNLEQNARIARYAFLERTAGNLHAFAVLTGHTVNDQAETFLMNLIRGSGVDGLSGMKSIRELDKEKVKSVEREIGRTTESRPDLKFTTPLVPGSPDPPVLPRPVLLIRPLLNWAKRIDTEGYCHDSGVDYRYDTMNEDTAFKRVRIRKVLLPLLEDLNPNIIETLANTAGLMQHLSDAHSPAEDDESPPELELAFLKSLSKPDLYRKIRSWLRAHRGTTRQLELKHILAIERLILSEKSGRTAELPGGECVIRSGGKLAFDKNRVEN